MLIAAASSDGTVSVWDVGSYTAAALWRVALNEDGRLLATSSTDGGGTVKIWDADTRRALFTLGSQLGEIYGLAFSPDGTQLVTANSKGEATVWDLKTHHPIVGPFPTGLTGKAVELAWPDGKSLVIAASQKGGAKVWDPANSNLSPRFGGPEQVQALALSADGHRLATVSLNGDRLEIWEGRIEDPIWSIDSGKDPFKDVVLSPDGQYVASVRRTGLVELRDVRSRELLPPLPANYLAHDSVSAQNGMAFSPDGTRLAIAFAKSVEIWDIAKKGNAEFIKFGGVNALAFSRDGKRLATGSLDGTFQVWPLAAEDLIAAAQRQRLTTRPLSDDDCIVYNVEPCPK
jgi:WD40 repeat protein